MRAVITGRVTDVLDNGNLLITEFSVSRVQEVDNKGKQVMDGANPYWSWTHVHAHDVQSNRMTRLKQVKRIAGGYEMFVNQGVEVYDKYLTSAALRRLGT